MIEAVCYHQVDGLCELTPKGGCNLRYCVGADARLVVAQLLVFVTLLEHREELDDVRVVVIELVARPIEAHNERAMPRWRRRGDDGAQVGGVQTGMGLVPLVSTSGE